MSDTLLRDVSQSRLKTDLPEIHIGDTIDVHVKIVEGSKERIQVFRGVLLKMRGVGIEQTITVRRIVANEGVERTFPLHSPRIARMQVIRGGHVRRAKLYYLRERVGKKRRLQDKRRGLNRQVNAQEAAAVEQSMAHAQSLHEAKEDEHHEAPVQEETGGRKQ